MQITDINNTVHLLNLLRQKAEMFLWKLCMCVKLCLFFQECAAAAFDSLIFICPVSIVTDSLWQECY